MNIFKLMVMASAFIGIPVFAGAEFSDIRLSQREQSKLQSLYFVSQEMVQSLGLDKTLRAISSFEDTFKKMNEGIVPSLPQDNLLPYFNKFLMILKIYIFLI